MSRVCLQGVSRTHTRAHSPIGVSTGQVSDIPLPSMPARRHPTQPMTVRCAHGPHSTPVDGHRLMKSQAVADAWTPGPAMPQQQHCGPSMQFHNACASRTSSANHQPHIITDTSPSSLWHHHHHHYYWNIVIEIITIITVCNAVVAGMASSVPSYGHAHEPTTAQKRKTRAFKC